MPTAKQILDFKQSVIWPNMSANDWVLESSIDWIRDNLNPEDIFSETTLEKWAEANGYVKEDKA